MTQPRGQFFCFVQVTQEEQVRIVKAGLADGVALCALIRGLQRQAWFLLPFEAQNGEMPWIQRCAAQRDKSVKAALHKKYLNFVASDAQVAVAAEPADYRDFICGRKPAVPFCISICAKNIGTRRKKKAPA